MSASNQRLELISLECRQICCSLLFNKTKQKKTKQNKSLFSDNGPEVNPAGGQSTGNFANPGRTGGLRGRKRDATEGGTREIGIIEYPLAGQSVGWSVVMYHYCPYHYCVYYNWLYRYYRY